MQLGDVPYSEALKGEDGLVKPKYDTQESVMINLINDLEKAASLFDKASNFEGDPILNGDITKWRKVVDAFRLKNVAISFQERKSYRITDKRSLCPNRYIR